MSGVGGEGVAARPGDATRLHATAPAVVEGPLGVIHVRVEYATFTRRLWALVLDLLLLGLLAMLLAAAVHGNHTRPLLTLLALLWFVGATIEGGTIGKRLLSLRVVRVDGGSVNLVRAFLREPVGKALSTLALFGGFFWMLDQPQRRTWHDLLAGTVVVRELRGGAPTWAAAPPWLASPVATEVVLAPRADRAADAGANDSDDDDVDRVRASDHSEQEPE